ncbi:unnamed protein product [Trichobilharzia regenti]|nr:unnamed protein product [Trichobilharzia regenti]
MSHYGIQARPRLGSRYWPVNDVFYIDQFDGNAHIRGTLHLTLTHIFFLGLSRRQEIWLQNQLISSVERLPLTTGGAPLVIRGKDFRVLRLILLKERDCHDVYLTLTKLIRVANVSELPCYRFVPPDCYWPREEGWSMFSLESQYNRFGLPNSFWTLTNVNNNFEVSYKKSIKRKKKEREREIYYQVLVCKGFIGYRVDHLLMKSPNVSLTDSSS